MIAQKLAEEHLAAIELADIMGTRQNQSLVKL